MKGEKMTKEKEKRFSYSRKGEKERICRFCGNRHGVIRKYGLLICRKCFREKAEELGFRKYGD